MREAYENDPNKLVESSVDPEILETA